MLVLLLVLAGIVALIVYTTKLRKERLEKLGFSSKDLSLHLKYISGHPDIVTSKLLCMGVKDGEIYLLNINNLHLEGVIPIDVVKNIEIKDTQQLDKIKYDKKNYNPLSFYDKKGEVKFKKIVYLVIEWNDGRFEHDTTFAIEGGFAMQTANMVRN